MKVCHLISSLRLGHGPSNVVMGVLGNCPDRSIRMMVCSMYAPPPDRDPESVLRAIGVDYHKLSIASRFLDLWVLFPLVKLLKDEAVDVLHCHLVRANLYGRIAGLLARTPVVISTMHNIEDYMTNPQLLMKLVRQFERSTARLVTKYVAVSGAVRSALIRHMGIDGTHIRTISNGIDFPQIWVDSEERNRIRAEVGARSDATIVVSAGRLDQQKHYERLVLLARTLKSRFPLVQFLIVGEGQEREMLDDMIRQFDLQGQFLLTGFRSDVARVLQSCDIFALPSLYEGLPMALIEAMAAGLPCVVTDVGGCGEAVVDGETGFLVSAKADGAFENAVMQLLDDCSLREKMGHAGRHRAMQRFSSGRMAMEYLSLWNCSYEASK
jgi:glycosyltransferase involved in cell wall biosynthesis